jgi:hypothetical protein
MRWLMVAIHAATLSYCALMNNPLQAQAAGSTGVPDARLEFAVSEFHATWQRAWRDSEEFRRLHYAYADLRRRLPFVQCHRRFFSDDRERQPEARVGPMPDRFYTLVPSAFTARGVCPSWLLTRNYLDAEDETFWLDGALRPDMRPIVANSRARLLALLEEARDKAPADFWIVGALVRFQLDARDSLGARATTQKCASAAWWCAALEGLLELRLGAAMSADLAFARMRRAMPDSVRCDWDDVGPLLPSESQAEYYSQPCAARERVHAVMWWLADPLYRESGNARRAEHYARRVELALARATTQNGRITLEPVRGGDATATMLLRYGWPSYRGWLGVAFDRNLSFQGLQINERAPESPPYTSYEYSLDRVHVMPTWAAIVEPFKAIASDWKLAMEDSTGTPAATWWPIELYKPTRRLVELPVGQTVSVRRQSGVDVVSAVVLSHPLISGRTGGRAREQFDVLLLASSDPAHLDSVDQRMVMAGDTVRLRGRVPNHPVLLAVEAQSGSLDGPVGRSRFGYSPPAPLAAQPPGTFSLSDLAVLEPVSAEQLTTPNDTMLASLRPTLVLNPQDRRITLYWESYGSQPSDSAQLSLRVVPADDVGLFRRLASTVGVLDDPKRALELRWGDRDKYGGLSTLSGPVPAQMRAITLDLSRLVSGRYVIEVEMRLRDGRTASQRTHVELAP